MFLKKTRMMMLLLSFFYFHNNMMSMCSQPGPSGYKNQEKNK